MTEKSFEDRIIALDLPECSKVYIVPLADFHLGAVGVKLDVIRGYIDWIKQRDNARTLLNGDLLNCAGIYSGPSIFEDLVTPDTAYAQLRELLKPIKDKILFITLGNHEEKIFRQVGCDYMSRLAYDLGDVPYRPNGGMAGIRLHNSGHRAMLWMYATHGWGGARTIGAKVNKVEELAKAVGGCHLYILSHDHTQNVHRLNPRVPPKSGITFHRQMYQQTERKLLVNTGGFYDYVGYIRRRGYAPQDIGTPRILAELRRSRQEDWHLDLHSTI